MQSDNNQPFWRNIQVEDRKGNANMKMAPYRANNVGTDQGLQAGSELAN
jgi:hypothetical protein